ncbi:TatD family hydrolase [Haliangium ochraceum]|uniref:Hydrolase, TatD family n=1 Tax=Haliangium ochraceum (strain DSM 14365 / JCM 11303 / SMP-2) TaxID=502025 RepID=D0LK75_HALO1|nr:TatD family hydrolase [Haliangium ochraceum]ACY13109.1 hydrolase, TatD family [Haliangium ochraceum DSM 14365]
MQFIDSHAHIDAADFDSDRPEMLARAHSAGVREIVCVGAADDLETAERTVAFAETHEGFYATVGIHPHNADAMQPGWWSELETLAARAPVVGVGETGLDYFYDNSPREQQRDCFARFLALGRALGLPVVCHVRDAHDDARAILREADAGSIGAVIHCFTGTPEDAAAYVDMGLYVSFSGIVTFPGKRSAPVREAVRKVPADRLLIETDCPYLAPVPERGKRNEPAFLVHTAEVVAREAGMSLAELADATAANTRRFFGLPTPPA